MNAFPPLRTLLAVSAAFVLASCAAPRDPADAGFFGGLYHGVLTDNFEQDAAALQQQAQAAEARRDQLQREASRLEGELASLAGERRDLQNRLARLNRNLAARSAQLDDAELTEATEQRRLEELRAREAELARRQLNTGAGAVGDDDLEAEIRRLEADNDRLSRDIDAFLAELS